MKTLELSDEQIEELERAAKCHAKAYMRTKALVLLNLITGEGENLTQVARRFQVSRQSVYTWRKLYLERGMRGLLVKKGRGRKGQVDLDDLAEHVKQSPRNFGIMQSRWTLQSLSNVVESMRGMTPSGVWRALRRAGHSYKRGQPVPHSPDPQYAEKKKNIFEALTKARTEPDEVVLLYQDEKTVYRQPTQAWLFYPTGTLQPRLKYGAHYNNCMRLVGYLNAVTGAVHWSDCGSVTVDYLIKSVRRLPDLYPTAKCIYLVWDNWQNHRHKKMFEAIAKVPRLRVLHLPTYAPWLNPIEKLWRWLNQTLLHDHPWHDDFRELRKQVAMTLNTQAAGTPELLRYVGLSPDLEQI